MNRTLPVILTLLSAFSAPAQNAPTIATQPTNQTVPVGGNAVFRVAVSGNGPLDYHWQFNGTNFANFIGTAAGNGGQGFSGDGGVATNAGLNDPNGVTVDASGNVLVADTSNNRIRKVGTNGVVTTVAGNGTNGFSGDGGAATAAELNLPTRVAVDGAGNLFIADSSNHRIRRVGTNGIITTVAGGAGTGSGPAGYSGDGGAATNAALNGPLGAVVDGFGNLFIADFGNNAIRRVGTNGVITTVAGLGPAGVAIEGFSGDGGAATNAGLNGPSDVAVDGLGNLFIADSGNNRIRKVGTNGIISTVAGNGARGSTTIASGYLGDGGPATNATLVYPAGLALGGFGNLFIADSRNNVIREVGPDGIITTVAGDGFVNNLEGFGFSFAGGYSNDGAAATNAELNNPYGVVVDGFGNVFIADSANNRIREVFAYGPTLSLSNASLANAGNYDAVVTSPFGSVTSSIAVLTVPAPPEITQQPTSQAAPVGSVATFRVSAVGSTPLGYQWYFDGAAMTGRTNSALGLTNLTSASAGNYEVVVTNLYGSLTSVVAVLRVGLHPTVVAEPTNQTVVAEGGAAFTVGASGPGPFSYKWQFNGTDLPEIIGTVAGGGTNYPGDGGAALNAELSAASVVADGAGNFFIADSSNNRIRKVGTNGIITTVAGNGLKGYSGDGGQATNADLNNPHGVAVDGSGNLFIADSSNNRIRKVGTNGIITTVAGNGFVANNLNGYYVLGGYSGDGGPATNAELNVPTGVAADSGGNLFIADNYNSRIRKVDTNGVISTVAGNGAFGYSGDGGIATYAALQYPFGVAVDAGGNLFIADTDNFVVRRVGADGIITTVAGKGSYGFSGDGGLATSAYLGGPLCVAVDGDGNLYIADGGNRRVRLVNVGGVITTVAGNGGSGYFPDGIAATNAGLGSPVSVALDGKGDLLIAANNLISEVFAFGPTLALNGIGAANEGNYDAVVTSPFGSVTSSTALLSVLLPPSITRQPSGQALLVGSTATLNVSAAGTPPLSYQWYFGGAALAGNTNTDLEITDASPANAGEYEVVVTNLYGAARSGARVAVGIAPSMTMQPTNQTVLAGGNARFSAAVSGSGAFDFQWQFNGTNLPRIIATVAGGDLSYGTYSGDGGAATNAHLAGPYGVAVDGFGNLFVADSSNSRVRKVGTNGVITTVAGIGYNLRSGGGGLSQAGSGYSGDGGAATNAELNNPAGVAVDGMGDLFIADTGNNRIRRVDTNGVIITVAGNGAAGYSGDGRAAINAALFNPVGVAPDGFGSLFIADENNQRVRKVDANGVITTVAGNGAAGYAGDGGPAAKAALNAPAGVAVDFAGNLLIADSGNQRIRKVATDGIISTVAGNGSAGDSGDGGPATNAGLNVPTGVTVDGAGNLFFIEIEGNRVREVETNGMITTVAGNGLPGYSGDGGPATGAELNFPNGVAVDGHGNLFIADTDNNGVREVFAYGATLTVNDASAANAGNYEVVVEGPFGSVTSGIATLTVVSPPLLNATLASGNGLTLQLTGTPGQAYILQSASSLLPPANWQNIFTNAADASGNWTFTNAISASSIALYYRVVAR